MAEPLTVHIQAALDRFLGGDPAGKKELINLSERRLMILARKVLRQFAPNTEETAAVLNEAFLKLNRALDEVRPATVREFFALAALQMRRVLLDLARAAGRRIRPAGGGTDGGFDQPDPGPGGQTHLDLMTDLDAAVDRLPDDLKEVVHLHYYQGLTYDEMAKVIAVHPDTVKRMIARAKVALQKHLSAFGPDPA